MNIREYLFKHELTLIELAEQLGITNVYLSSIITAKNRPSTKLAGKIEEITNGEVTLTEAIIANKPYRKRTKA